MIPHATHTCITSHITLPITTTMLRHMARLLTGPTRFGFCSQPVASNILGDDKATTFYRNSIRRININSKGRGKFTQHNLLRLIKLVESSQQQQLLLEAYYNYIGHFTLMDSSTVDKMLTKIMSLEGCTLSPLVKLLHNHNYLGYFPHYRVTNQLLRMTAPDQRLHMKLMSSLMLNPLIKFNRETVTILSETLENVETPHSVASQVVKLFIHRMKQGIIQDVASEQELKSVIANHYQAGIEGGNFRAHLRSSRVQQWVEQQQPEDEPARYQLALIALGNRLPRPFVSLLDQIQSEDLVDKLVTALAACSLSYKKSAIHTFKGTSENEILKERLSAIDLSGEEGQQEIQETEDGEAEESPSEGAETK